MAKGSRKGKKAWRKNIDTAAIEVAAEEETRNERLGTDVGALPDTELFFIDKGRSEQAPARRLGAGERKKKVLRSQAILDAAHQAKPVIKPPVSRKLQKRRLHAPSQALAAVAERTEQPKRVDVYDVWDSDVGQKEKEEDFDDIARAVAAKERTPFGIVRPAKRRKKDPAPPIRPVEVDEPGCSYNPDREQHEEVVAHAVAVEVQKNIEKELCTPAVLPKRVDWQPDDDPLMLDQVGVLEEEEDTDADKEDQGVSPGQQRRTEKKTKSKRNREARVKEQEAELAEKKKLKQQRRELQNLKVIQQEIEEAETEKRLRQQRKQVMKAEKAAVQPPRLGKVKYQDAPIQVLLSSEIDGSLRKLKATPMLASDRFKSLQKRGIIEPRVPRIKSQKRKGKA